MSTRRHNRCSSNNDNSWSILQAYLLVPLLLITCHLRAMDLDLTPDEVEYLSNKPLITYCIDPESMSYEAIEGQKHIGMSKDYVGFYSVIVNKPFALIQTISWDESLEKAKARECDVLTLAMPTPSREEYLNFTPPYLRVPMVIATTFEKDDINHIKDIIDKPIAAVKDYAFVEIIKNQYPEAIFVEVNNMEEGLDLVMRGKVYGYLGSLSAIGYHLQVKHLNHIRVNGNLGMSWSLGLAVRNDEPELTSVLTKASNAITKEQHSQVLEKWITVKYHSRYDYTLIIQIVLGFIVLLIFIIYRQNQLKKYNTLLERISMTDPLTKLFNRLKVAESLNKLLYSYKRYGDVFSIVLLDIDNFKNINDAHGHLIGDKVLIQVANLLIKNSRKIDTVGRWGGEEFLIICPKTRLGDVLKLAKKLRLLIEEDSVGDIKVTASFGVAQVMEGDDQATIVSRADRALYEAKKSGRNQVNHQ